jgi:hypothetical protein
MPVDYDAGQGVECQSEFKILGLDEEGADEAGVFEGKNQM